MSVPTSTTAMTTSGPLSPALSATSTSSYDLLSNSVMSTFEIPTTYDSDDDRIVWSLSEGDAEGEGSSTDPNASSDDSGAASDDDFVLLSPSVPPSGRTTVLGCPSPSARVEQATAEGLHSQTPVTATNVQSLERQMATMGLKAQTPSASRPSPKTAKKPKVVDPDVAAAKKARKKARRKAKKAAEARAAAKATPSSPPTPKKEKKASTPTPTPAKAVTKRTGLGSRPIVDDISDRLSVSGDESTDIPSLYEEASTFISRFLSNPDVKHSSIHRLTLLQSLIIELGLVTSHLSLPASLRSAKSILKSRAFLNIKEYLAIREQGPEAVQRAMYPSRSALIKNIRKKPNNRASLQWVKEHGLQVLLVGWAH